MAQMSADKINYTLIEYYQIFNCTCFLSIKKAATLSQCAAFK
jgi:hypothetical protein